MESITGKSMFLCLIALVLNATFAGSGAHAHEGTLEIRYRGVTFIAVPVRTGNYYGRKIMGTRQAAHGSEYAFKGGTLVHA